MAGTWQRLAHVELSSSGDSLDTGAFTAKKYLWVQIKRYRTGSVNSRIRVNGDSGSNYAHRYSGGANSYSESTSINQTSIYSHAATSNESLTNYFITNKADKEKLMIIEEVNGGAAGAGNAPARAEVVAKWTNTSDQITSIQCINTDSGDLTSGTYITVFGASDDVVTDEKTTLTNIPVNTRYEETDTRKIFRAKQVGFAGGSSGSGSDWTEVSFDSSTAVNNATASGNVVSRSSGSNWTSYIRSSTHYLDPSEGGGEVYFTVSDNSHGSVGLEKAPYNSTPSDVYTSRDYSFHTTTATNNIYESTSSYDGTDWNSSNDEFRITMDSAGLVKYYWRTDSSSSWNLERTSTVTASGKYYVSVSPHSTATCTSYIKSSSTIAWKERGTA